MTKLFFKSRVLILLVFVGSIFIGCEFDSKPIITKDAMEQYKMQKQTMAHQENLRAPPNCNGIEKDNKKPEKKFDQLLVAVINDLKLFSNEKVSKIRELMCRYGLSPSMSVYDNVYEEMTPLPFYVQSKKQYKVLFWLIDFGLDPNIKDSNGTPLLVKEAESDGGHLKDLINKKANPNAQDRLGNTALHTILYELNCNEKSSYYADIELLAKITNQKLVGKTRPIEKWQKYTIAQLFKKKKCPWLAPFK